MGISPPLFPSGCHPPSLKPLKRLSINKSYWPQCRGTYVNVASGTSTWVGISQHFLCWSKEQCLIKVPHHMGDGPKTEHDCSHDLLAFIDRAPWYDSLLLHSHSNPWSPLCLNLNSFADFSFLLLRVLPTSFRNDFSFVQAPIPNRGYV